MYVLFGIEVIMFVYTGVIIAHNEFSKNMPG